MSRYDFAPKEEDDERAIRFKSKGYMDDYINPRDVLKAEEVFNQVLARFRAAEMPPPTAKQPTFNESRSLRQVRNDIPQSRRKSVAIATKPEVRLSSSATIGQSISCFNAPITPGKPTMSGPASTRCTHILKAIKDRGRM